MAKVNHLSHFLLSILQILSFRQFFTSTNPLFLSELLNVPGCMNERAATKRAFGTAMLRVNRDWIYKVQAEKGDLMECEG